MAKSFAWSYSVLDSFETCPWRHYQVKILKKFTEPQTEQLLWGNKVHKALENRIKGAALPVDMQDYEPLARSVTKRPGRVEAEQRLCINSNLQPVKYFADDAWARSITDFTVDNGRAVFVGDWKTGNPKPNSAQLELSAAMVFSHRPYVTKIITAFVWLKTGTVTHETFSRDDIPDIWQKFMPRVQRLQIAIQETKFPPKPSGLCREYCPVRTCEHNGKYSRPRG